MPISSPGFDLTVSWGCHEGQWLLGVRHREPQDSCTGSWIGSTLVARAAGGSRISPSPGHWALPWNGLRVGWDTGSLVSLTPWMHSWARQGCEELETGPAVAVLGQGLMALGELKWGPGLWPRFGSTWEGWPGSVRPADASMSLAIIFSFVWLYLNLFLFFKLIIFVMNYITIK